MSTYKQCKKCEQIVKWEPIEPIQGENYIMHYPECIGGNRLMLCPLITNQLKIKPPIKESNL